MVIRCHAVVTCMVIIKMVVSNDIFGAAGVGPSKRSKRFQTNHMYSLSHDSYEVGNGVCIPFLLKAKALRLCNKKRFSFNASAIMSDRALGSAVLRLSRTEAFVCCPQSHQDPIISHTLRFDHLSTAQLACEVYLSCLGKPQTDAKAIIIPCLPTLGLSRLPSSHPKPRTQIHQMFMQKEDTFRIPLVC